MTDDDANSAPSPESLQRPAISLFRPWWRATLFIAAVVWCAVLNIVFIGSHSTNDWIGLVSLVPLFAFALEGAVRSVRVSRRRP